MRNGLLVVLLATLGLSGCTMWKEHPASAWTDATGGESLERVFWQEVKAGHWNQLEARLAGNFVAVTPQEGKLDRDAFLEHLKLARIDDYSLGDVQTELNTRTMVVTYTLTLRGTFQGQPLPSAPVRMMSVWQQQQTGWVEIAHTVIVTP